MNFTTHVELPAGLPPVRHGQRLLLMGSCFAEHLGERLSRCKFRTDINPFGILYNPSSAAEALRRIIAGKAYGQEELFHYRECWHSPMHHSSFSAGTPEETLRRINCRLEQAHAALPDTDWLMLTFGTAYVYLRKETGETVANCHQLPESCFERQRLSAEEIAEDYTALIARLQALNPKLKLLFTVSPIRHLRDGLHGNQLSKAVLLTAVDRLCRRFPETAFYFPSYEIVLDELRDYRFYADDMTHPSPTALAYLWERFGQVFFDEETVRLSEAAEAIQRDLSHRPFRPESDAYKTFLGKIVLKIKQLTKKYPYLDFQKELELCHIPLKK